MCSFDFRLLCTRMWTLFEYLNSSGSSVGHKHMATILYEWIRWTWFWCRQFVSNCWNCVWWTDSHTFFGINAYLDSFLRESRIHVHSGRCACVLGVEWSGEERNKKKNFLYIIVLFRLKQIECVTENDKIQTTTHDFSRNDKLQSGGWTIRWTLMINWDEIGRCCNISVVCLLSWFVFPEHIW